MFTKKNRAVLHLLCITLLSVSMSKLGHASPQDFSNTAIPDITWQAMQKYNLQADALSFVVTPLNHIDDKNAQQHLPLEQVKKKLRKQLAELLRRQQTQREQVDSDDELVKLLEKQAKARKKLQTAIDELSLNTQARALDKTYQHRAKQPRTPASTMKLIPTFIGLDSLGKAFVWETKVYHTGYRVGKTLHGDLVIQGSGDPKLTHQKLANLLFKVKQLGIEHIDGDILIDSGVFRNVTKDPAKFDNDPLRPYNASPDGMLVNFSTITIETYPDKHHAALVYQPNLANIKLPEKLALRSGRCQSIKRSLAPVWYSERLAFKKNLPTACGRHTFYIAYPDAKKFAEQVVKAKWLAMGNTLTGQVGQLPKSAIDKRNKLEHKSATVELPIASEFSYPLANQIYDINHYSNNVMTEQLLLSLPVYKGIKEKALYSDYQKSIAYVDDWWQKNLKSKPPYMTNGSGLCRNCTVTANNLNELLVKAYQHADFDVYVKSLGVAGVSGTIKTHKYRRPQSAAIGRAWIKTGTLNNVTAMAGYIKGQSGQEYSVVAIINLPKGTKGANRKRPVLDSLIDWVAQH